MAFTVLSLDPFYPRPCLKLFIQITWQCLGLMYCINAS